MHSKRITHRAQQAQEPMMRKLCSQSGRSQSMLPNALTRMLMYSESHNSESILTRLASWCLRGQELIELVHPAAVSQRLEALSC